MEYKEIFKFAVTPLGSDNYFSWSQDVEVFLRGGLSKFDKSGSSETSRVEIYADENKYALRDLSRK